MQVALESVRSAEVAALIDALDAYLIPQYPLESHHGIDIDALDQPSVLFAVARDEGDIALGCGAMVLKDGYGELKRMYTRPEARGRGIATAVLALLEREARLRGCRHFALETGYLQAEAIALYTRAGYVRCEPFGEYKPDPHSVFMQKTDGARPPAMAG